MKLALNKLGRDKKCNICKNTFYQFSKYDGGKEKHVSAFVKKLAMIDSDFDNFYCMYCDSFDRERHLFLFFDALKMWELFKEAEVIHFAPEKNLSEKIRTISPKKYITADLDVYEDNMEKIDITKIPYAENTFDILLCNHVLEHVPDYTSAITELYRIIKPGGTAIIQIPYSEVLNKHFEETSFTKEDERKFFFGQEDHVRIFSKKHFLKDLQNAGFKLNIIKSTDIFRKDIAQRFGFNQKEDLIRMTK